MITNPAPWIRSALGMACAAAISSCAYDPGYWSTSTSYGGTYSSDGYSSLSTSIFISTGDPRWGYDPHCHSYYDYTRRCYYDPYLLGYYPVGYRPPVVIGVPHPHGWRPGVRSCPPPSAIRHHQLADYQHRERCYRQLRHSWADHVRTHPNPAPQTHANHQNRSYPPAVNPSTRGNRYGQSPTYWTNNNGSPSGNRYGQTNKPSGNRYGQANTLPGNRYRQTHDINRSFTNSRPQGPTHPSGTTMTRPTQSHRSKHHQVPNVTPAHSGGSPSVHSSVPTITPTQAPPATANPSTRSATPMRDMHRHESAGIVPPNDMRNKRNLR